MSAVDGALTKPFGDGDHTFRLAFGQWHELLETINRPRIEKGHPVIGPAVLYQSLLTMNAWPHDVREVLRLGLIGAGMKSDRALVLIKRYVEDQPFFANEILAGQVVHASMFGPVDDQVGKEPAPAPPETPATMDNSGLATTTGSVLQ